MENLRGGRYRSNEIKIPLPYITQPNLPSFNSNANPPHRGRDISQRNIRLEIMIKFHTRYCLQEPGAPIADIYTPPRVTLERKTSGDSFPTIFFLLVPEFRSIERSRGLRAHDRVTLREIKWRIILIVPAAADR